MRCPSRALNSPRALLLELERNKDTGRCATLGAEVTGQRQEQLTRTLIVRLLKTHRFLTPILDSEQSTEKNKCTFKFLMATLDPSQEGVHQLEVVLSVLLQERV